MQTKPFPLPPRKTELRCKRNPRKLGFGDRAKKEKNEKQCKGKYNQRTEQKKPGGARLDPAVYHKDPKTPIALHLIMSHVMHLTPRKTPPMDIAIVVNNHLQRMTLGPPTSRGSHNPQKPIFLSRRYSPELLNPIFSFPNVTPPLFLSQNHTPRRGDINIQRPIPLHRSLAGALTRL